MQEVLIIALASALAGIGTGFAGLSAAVFIAPMLTVFLGIPAYEAIGIALASDVLASAASAATYAKHRNMKSVKILPYEKSLYMNGYPMKFAVSILVHGNRQGCLQSGCSVCLRVRCLC